MGFRRNQPPKDESMLQGMGFAPDYPDATSDVYDQPQGTGEPYVHAGPDGQLGVYVDGQYVRSLTYEEAMQATNFQPTEVTDLPDATNGFSITQDLPSRGRISARVSVDFDAHGNAALLPDARELGIAMLASAGELAHQGGTQVRYEGYGDETTGQQANSQAGAEVPYYPATNTRTPQGYGYGYGTAETYDDRQQLPPGEQNDDYDENDDRPMTPREQRRWEKEQRSLDKTDEKIEKAHNAADKAAAKAAAREIGKRMASNPVKVLRLGVAALIFVNGYNLMTGDMSTNPVKIAKAYASTPWNVGQDLLWLADKIPGIPGK